MSKTPGDPEMLQMPDISQDLEDFHISIMRSLGTELNMSSKHKICVFH